jgi:cytoskeleton protein RodZ
VGEFGDRFRKAREKKELSLDDVSNVTKISARMLRAIEEEHFDQLPGGVFNKGFIRAYAKHLGLDPEEAVTDYLACLRQAQIDAQQVWEPPVSAKPASTKSASASPVAAPEKRRVAGTNKTAAKAPTPTRVEELPGLQLPRAEHVASQKEFGLKPDREIPWSILAIAAIVVALAVVLWIRRSHTGAASTPTPVKSVPSSITPSAPIPDPAPPVNQPPNPASAKNSATPAPSNSRPPQVAPSSPNANHASTATPAASNTTSTGGNEANNDVTTRNLSKPIPPPAKSTTASLTLVIRAQETSWISVQADGQQVSQETLIAPAHTSVRANREIIAKIGNAAGVTFLWNGREIPGDGAEAEVKTFIFDANGMRVLPTTQAAPNH